MTGISGTLAWQDGKPSKRLLRRKDPDTGANILQLP